MRRLVLVLALCACALATFAQGTVSTSPSSSQKAQSDALPSGLKAAVENPISRFEIVSLGSFPIMLFYTDFIFDLSRYIEHNFDSSYAPWPLKSEYSASLADKDRLTRIYVTLGASALVGGIDALVHQLKLRAAERKRAALEDAPAQAGAPGTPIPGVAPASPAAPASP